MCEAPTSTETKEKVEVNVEESVNATDDGASCDNKDDTDGANDMKDDGDNTEDAVLAKQMSAKLSVTSIASGESAGSFSFSADSLGD